jgi:hypothetical protein
MSTIVSHKHSSVHKNTSPILQMSNTIHHSHYQCPWICITVKLHASRKSHFDRKKLGQPWWPCYMLKLQYCFTLNKGYFWSSIHDNMSFVIHVNQQNLLRYLKIHHAAWRTYLKKKLTEFLHWNFFHTSLLLENAQLHGIKKGSVGKYKFTTFAPEMTLSIILHLNICAWWMQICLTEIRTRIFTDIIS